MIRAFLFNSPYSTAPFSTLYLFGRRQDLGFQQTIDNSPRKRHHVRFWALSLAHSSDDITAASFWLNTDKPSTDQPVLWVGAGTRDTGLSLTKLTFQVTHATDSDTNAERDHIVAQLKTKCVIGDVVLHQSRFACADWKGQPLHHRRRDSLRQPGQLNKKDRPQSLPPRVRGSMRRGSKCRQNSKQDCRGGP